MNESDFSDELRHRVREAAARLQVGFPRWVRPFVQRDVIGLTLGRTIYIAPGLLQRRADYVEAIIRHELAHVRQVGRHGLLGFLALYLWDYVRLRCSGLDHRAAYDAIPFEVEAREAEAPDLGPVGSAAYNGAISTSDKPEGMT